MTFTEYQMDTLREIVNIGIGRAAATLNEMLQQHVRLRVPYLSVIDPDTDGVEPELAKLSGSELAAVRLGFRGALNGSATIVFPPGSAAKLVAAITDGDEEDEFDDVDAIRTGALSEVGNIVINGVIGSLSNMMSLRLRYALPVYLEEKLEKLLRPTDSESRGPILLARTDFIVEELEIFGVIYVVFEARSFELLLKHIDQLSA